MKKIAIVALITTISLFFTACDFFSEKQAARLYCEEKLNELVQFPEAFEKKESKIAEMGNHWYIFYANGKGKNTAGAQVDFHFYIPLRYHEDSSAIAYAPDMVIVKEGEVDNESNFLKAFNNAIKLGAPKSQFDALKFE